MKPSAKTKLYSSRKPFDELGWEVERAGMDHKGTLKVF